MPSMPSSASSNQYRPGAPESARCFMTLQITFSSTGLAVR